MKKEALGKVGSMSGQTPPKTFSVQTPLDGAAVRTPREDEKGGQPTSKLMAVKSKMGGKPGIVPPSKKRRGVEEKAEDKGGEGPRP